MPSSDGKITHRDLASEAVLTRALRDSAVNSAKIAAEAVVTDKLADLATTISKMSDPVFVSTGTANGSDSPVLTNSYQTTATFSVTVPAWVGTLDIFAVGTLGPFNTATADTYYARVRIGGVETAVGNSYLPSGHAESITAPGRRTISAPGSSVAVDLQAYKGASGAGNDYDSIVSAVAVGVR